MLDALKCMGYRRPAMLLKRKSERNQLSQRAAIFEYLSRQLWELPHPLIYLYDDIPSELDQIEAWLHHVQPDVVLSSDRQFKAPVIRVLGQVPKDVGYVAIEHSAVGEEARIDFKPETVGAVGIDLVTAQLYRNERGIPAVVQAVQVESPFFSGTTLRCSEAPK